MDSVNSFIGTDVVVAPAVVNQGSKTAAGEVIALATGKDSSTKSFSQVMAGVNARVEGQNEEPGEEKAVADMSELNGLASLFAAVAMTQSAPTISPTSQLPTVEAENAASDGIGEVAGVNSTTTGANVAFGEGKRIIVQSQEAVQGLYSQQTIQAEQAQVTQQPTVQQVVVNSRSTIDGLLTSTLNTNAPVLNSADFYQTNPSVQQQPVINLNHALGVFAETSLESLSGQTNSSDDSGVVSVSTEMPAIQQTVLITQEQLPERAGITQESEPTEIEQRVAAGVQYNNQLQPVLTSNNPGVVVSANDVVTMTQVQGDGPQAVTNGSSSQQSTPQSKIFAQVIGPSIATALPVTEIPATTAKDTNKSAVEQLDFLSGAAVRATMLNSPQKANNPQQVNQPLPIEVAKSQTLTDEKISEAIDLVDSDAKVVDTVEKSSQADAKTGFSAFEQADSGEQVSLPTKQEPVPGFFANLLDQRTITRDNVAAVVNSAGTERQLADADSYNIAGQIVEQAQFIKTDGSSELVIKLRPEHLGELTVKVSISGSGATSATFHSDNPQVRGVIESSLQQLKQELANQGSKLDYVGVYAGAGQFFSNSGQREAQKQAAPKQQSRKIDDEEFTQTLKIAAEANHAVKAIPGVDYRV